MDAISIAFILSGAAVIAGALFGLAAFVADHMIDPFRGWLRDRRLRREYEEETHFERRPTLMHFWDASEADGNVLHDSAMSRNEEYEEATRRG